MRFAAALTSGHHLFAFPLEPRRAPAHKYSEHAHGRSDEQRNLVCATSAGERSFTNLVLVLLLLRLRTTASSLAHLRFAAVLHSKRANGFRQEDRRQSQVGSSQRRMLAAALAWGQYGFVACPSALHRAPAIQVRMQ